MSKTRVSCFIRGSKQQTPRNSKSTPPVGSCFESVSRCLEPLMKHSHLLLTYYLKLKKTLTKPVNGALYKADTDLSLH